MADVLCAATGDRICFPLLALSSRYTPKKVNCMAETKSKGCRTHEGQATALQLSQSQRRPQLMGCEPADGDSPEQICSGRQHGNPICQ